MEHRLKEIIYLGIFLAVTSAVAAGLLALTYVNTAARIAEEESLNYKQAVKEVLPQGVEGKVKKIKAKGWGSDIELLVGVDKNGKIAGVKILKIADTPGLGMNAADPKFLAQFIGKTAKDKFKAKQDVQAITGATITSQGVADGVKKALLP